MRQNKYYFRYLLFILAVIWALYFTRSIDIRQAISMTLGALAGIFIGIAIVQWLRKNNKL